MPENIPDDLSRLVSPELQEFIFDAENADEKDLVLRQKMILGIPASLVADQILGRRKAKNKLPSWYKTTGIVYPPSIHLEQASSELTARFKAGMMAATIPKAKSTGVDLTTGFGVDSLYLSRLFEKWECVDPDFRLLDITRRNLKLLGAENITYHQEAAEVFVTSSRAAFDFIFVDPSRRRNLQKVFRLADCKPDVVALLPSLMEKSGKVLIKASPLLDLQQGCAELVKVERVYVIAAENECREVLFLCSRTAAGETVIVCRNLSYPFPGDTSDEFTFTFDEERNTVSVYSDPLTYLYEPHAAILKAGAFKTIGNRYQLFKIQTNTHLNTSDTLVKDFPGRIFRIEALNAGKGRITSSFPDGKANVLTRNYPLHPDQIKKKLKLHDGGEKYLIGFSGRNRKFLVAAQRLK